MCFTTQNLTLQRVLLHGTWFFHVCFTSNMKPHSETLCECHYADMNLSSVSLPGTRFFHVFHYPEHESFMCASRVTWSHTVKHFVSFTTQNLILQRVLLHGTWFSQVPHCAEWNDSFECFTSNMKPHSETLCECSLRWHESLKCSTARNLILSSVSLHGTWFSQVFYYAKYDSL
jgi:hypothetical protein